MRFYFSYSCRDCCGGILATLEDLFACPADGLAVGKTLVMDQRVFIHSSSQRRVYHLSEPGLLFLARPTSLHAVEG